MISDRRYQVWIPSKAFLLGEHSVLQGSSALVTSAPGMEFSLEAWGPWERKVSPEFPFHPQSPAGKLIQWAVGENHMTCPKHWEWIDPYQGAGGMGGSTAEFAGVYRILSAKHPIRATWQGAWSLYRELTQNQYSGADLVAQWSGGTIEFRMDAPWPQVQPILPPEQPDPMRFLRWIPPVGFNKSVIWFHPSGVFGRNVNTHEVLKNKDSQIALPVEQISAWVQQAGEALKQNQPRVFAEAVENFANCLAEKGLEHPDTTLDRTELKKIPGVLAVKGCGAMMADLLLVIVEPENERARSAVIEWTMDERDFRIFDSRLEGLMGIDLRVR